MEKWQWSYIRERTTSYSPCCYTIVRSLATHLELEPLIELVLFLERVVRESLVRIILLDDVLDDGA